MIREGMSLEFSEKNLLLPLSKVLMGWAAGCAIRYRGEAMTMELMESPLKVVGSHFDVGGFC